MANPVLQPWHLIVASFSRFRDMDHTLWMRQSDTTDAGWREFDKELELRVHIEPDEGSDDGH